MCRKRAEVSLTTNDDNEKKKTRRKKKGGKEKKKWLYILSLFSYGTCDGFLPKNHSTCLFLFYAQLIA